MKQKRIVYGLVAVLVTFALYVVYYQFIGTSAPAGQQPLVRLDTSNIESLKRSFNESKDSVRLMVMLSPT